MTPRARYNITSWELVTTFNFDPVEILYIINCVFAN